MRSLLFILMLSTTTFGCDNKEGTKWESKPGLASNAHRAADDKATEDLQARRAEEAKATEAKAAADADAVAAHKVTHDQLQARFDASDRRLNAMTEEVARTTGTKKKNATAAAAAAATVRPTVMASIARLRDATLAQWDAAKAQVEADAVTFDKAIDTLEATLR